MLVGSFILTYVQTWLRNFLLVECQFYGDIGVTIIKHNHTEPNLTSQLGTLDGCYDPGCYSDNITYDATPEEGFQINTCFIALSHV